MTRAKFDILIWAHSDQEGGTEIACVLWSAIVEVTSNPRIAILTPFPEAARRFFENERRRPDLGKDIIPTQKFLALEKKNGIVDAGATYKSLLERPFHNLASSVKDEIVNFGKRIETHPRTLMISCGEPVAIEVAKFFELRGVIVTDHLLTCSVRRVLDHGGLLDPKMTRLLTTFELYELSAEEAFLSPLEFASDEYEKYLSYRGKPYIPLGGLFYESPRKISIESMEPYQALREAAGNYKVVFVFGGGGVVWLRLYQYLHRMAKSMIKGKKFALLVPGMKVQGNLGREKNKAGQFIYKLYRPDDTIQTLVDPGRLMYWYAACELAVIRGGLATQQIFALMLSDLENVPQILFIEEPGHPQIEHERASLYRLRFVHTGALADFREDPAGLISRVLAAMSKGQHPRERVAVRYCRSHLLDLAKYLIVTYKPMPGPRLTT